MWGGKVHILFAKWIQNVPVSEIGINCTGSVNSEGSGETLMFARTVKRLSQRSLSSEGLSMGIFLSN